MYGVRDTCNGPISYMRLGVLLCQPTPSAPKHPGEPVAPQICQAPNCLSRCHSYEWGRGPGRLSRRQAGYKGKSFPVHIADAMFINQLTFSLDSSCRIAQAPIARRYRTTIFSISHEPHLSTSAEQTLIPPCTRFWSLSRSFPALILASRATLAMSSSPKSTS